MGEQSARLVSITPSLMYWLDEYAINDLVDYFDPDAIFVADEPDSNLDYSEVRNQFDSVVFYPEEENKRIRHVPVNGIDFVVIDGVDNLDVVEQLEETGRLDSDTYTYLLTTDIDVKLDTTELTASLMNEDEYKSHTGASEGKYVYITGSLPSHYKREWDEMVVQGGRPKESEGGLTIPCITCHADGQVGVKTLRSTKLGLRALDGVGRRTAEKLKENGYETRSDVARATRGELKEIYGIGQKTANRLFYHSRAIERAEVRRRNNERPIPGKEPIFIDIVTDGVTPTVIWHIGAYNAATNEYQSFIARTPDQRAEIIQSFISWYTAEGQGQTLISWRGWEFDYRHLSNFIAEHAPNYMDVWENASKRDLYYWAIEQDNAVLPGRTNDLEEVSSALGFEYDVETGLTEDHIRNQYRRWMAGEIGEPDWELLQQFCQNKVMALVKLYDRMSIKENVHGD